MIKKISSSKLLLFFLFLVTSHGCGIWYDFTTYFNLYYNAKDKFQEAETAIMLQRKNLLEFEDPNISGNVPQLLNQVIEKCSKILQFHEKSSYVDNALLILGKSFFYQKNYQKALRKFQELAVTYPESNLSLENDLWTAKTQIRLKDYNNAFALLKQVRKQATDNGEDDILKWAYVEEIVYLINTEKFSQAISLMNEFLEFSSDDQANAEIVFEMGKLYIKTDDIENAITAFRKVNSYSPSLNFELNAQIELAIALRDNQQKDESLAILENLRSERKYSDSFDRIELETGLTLYSLDRVDEAVNILIKVDTSYGSSQNSGIAKFKLGQIFESYYKNFDSASTYYTRAASSTIPPELIKPASEKAQLFNKYKNIQKNIFDAKKQLTYLEDPDSFIRDSLEYYSDTLTTVEGKTQTEFFDFFDEGRNVGENENPVQTQPPITQIKTDPKKSPPTRPVLSADSLKQIILKNEFDIANLFYTELNVPDSAFVFYKNIVDNHPESVYYLRSLYSLAMYYKSIDSNEEADSIFNYIYENYRTESIANAAAVQLNKPLINLKYDPADELYIEAEKKLLESNFSESVKKFYEIFLTHPQSPVAAKALYAGGWVLENELKLLDSAAVFYDSVDVRYPQSQYASIVRSKLIFYKQELAKQKQTIQDSLMQIESDKLEKKDDEIELNEKLKQKQDEPEDKDPFDEKNQEEFERELKEKELLKGNDELEFDALKQKKSPVPK